MIDVNQLRKKTTFTLESEIYKVLDFEHRKMGRGGATIRVQVRNLRSGSVTEMTFDSGNRIEDIEVDKHPVEFLYDDGQFLVFMNTATYDQPQVNRSVFEEALPYLKENMALTLFQYGDEIIDYELPANADYTVTEAAMAVAGDTAAVSTKRVTIETGLTVQVPMFVQQGDTIRVRTEDGSYVTRVQ
ncbi:MAG: elongation factor P [Phototrophicaceae bacterium]|jgi:elongation factor P